MFTKSSEGERMQSDRKRQRELDLNRMEERKKKKMMMKEWEASRKKVALALFSVCHSTKWSTTMTPKLSINQSSSS
jgi:hypothetical protein